MASQYKPDHPLIAILAALILNHSANLSLALDRDL